MVLHQSVTSLDEAREFYVETLKLFRETPWMCAEEASNCMLQFIGDYGDQRRVERQLAGGRRPPRDATKPQAFGLHLSLKLESGRSRITLPVDDPLAVFKRVKASRFYDKLSEFQAHPFGTWFDVADPFGNDISIEWYCEGASSGFWAEKT